MASLPPPFSRFFKEQLHIADVADRQAIKLIQGGESFLEVPSAGKTVSGAYEQLRNAAENSEEQLLLQRAIKRFFKLNMFTAKLQTSSLCTELITELVLSGYISNGSVSKVAISQLDQVISTYEKAYENLLLEKTRRDLAMDWILACLSTDIADALNPHSKNRALVALSYQYFLNAFANRRVSTKINFELSLYIATHQSLNHSDIDIVRADIRNLYSINPTDATVFIRQNIEIDTIFSSRLTSKLRRLVTKYGAPLRIIKGMIHDRTDLPNLLDDSTRFMDAYNSQISREYARTEKRLTNGLIKSILFIFITKMIIGVSIEIPYDLLSRGVIEWKPLIINLLFPPLYLAILRLSVAMPSAANIRRLSNEIQNILFTDTVRHIVIPRDKTLSITKQLLYPVMFALPVAAVIATLYALHFNVVQMIIFFVFFSTASSLGFRLSSQARELEIHHASSGFFVSIRDFFYMPFIVIGQWLNMKYRQINFVGRVLDIVIELPLKAVLRLIRQWIRFLDDQREELY